MFDLEKGTTLISRKRNRVTRKGTSVVCAEEHVPTLSVAFESPWFVAVKNPHFMLTKTLSFDRDNTRRTNDI